MDTISVEKRDEYYAQIMEGINSGGTKLPSSDIQNNPTLLTNDPNMVPSYIPEPTYHEQSPSYQHQQQPPTYYQQPEPSDQKYQRNLLDYFLTYMKSPILLCFCYFIFQMPIIKLSLVALLPSFFITNDTTNIYGLIIVSILFAISFMILEKTIKKLED
jgi:hypothetical protein